MMADEDFVSVRLYADVEQEANAEDAAHEEDRVPLNSQNYEYTLVAPAIHYADRRTVYQIAGHRQLLVQANGTAQEGGVYFAVGQYLLKLILCYGAFILVGVVGTFVLDLLLEQFILFHNTVPSFFDHCKDADGSEGSLSDCNEATRYLSWSIVTFTALPILLSVGSFLLTLAIGMLGDVWASFEWAKACMVPMLSHGWFHYVLVIAMPTSVFSIASFTSGENTVELIRCIEIAVISGYVIMFVSYLLLFLIVQYDTVYCIAKNKIQRERGISENSAIWKHMFGQMIKARYKALIVCLDYFCFKCIWMSHACSVASLCAVAQLGDEGDLIDAEQRNEEERPGPVAEADESSDRSPERSSNADGTGASRLNPASLYNSSPSGDATPADNESSSGHQQRMGRNPGNTPFQNAGSAESSSESLEMRNICDLQLLITQNHREMTKQMKRMERNVIKEVQDIQVRIPREDQTQQQTEDQGLPGQGPPPGPSPNHATDAGYLNSNTFDLFFLCCIQLRNVLPGNGQKMQLGKTDTYLAVVIPVVMGFLLILGFGGYIGSEKVFKNPWGASLMFVIVLLIFGMISCIIGNIQQALKISGVEPQQISPLKFPSQSCVQLSDTSCGNCLQSTSNCSETCCLCLRDSKKIGPICLFIFWDVIICHLLPVISLAARCSQDARHWQFLLFFLLFALMNGFLKLFNVDRAFGMVSDTDQQDHQGQLEQSAMQTLQDGASQETRGDETKLWKVGRRVHLLRTRIDNAKLRTWVWGGLVFALFLYVMMSGAPLLTGGYDGTDTEVKAEQKIWNFKQENLNRNISANGTSTFGAPPACLGSYTMDGMIPNMTALDYAILNMISYSSSNASQYKEGKSLEQQMLDAYFGEQAVILEMHTRFSPTEPATRVFRVSSTITRDNGVQNHVIVAVRGTKNGVDWLANINMWIEVSLVQFLRLLLPFGSVWDAAYPDLIKALGLLNYFQRKDTFRPDYALEDYWKHDITRKMGTDDAGTPTNYVFTGHSLGGGIAAITASRIGHPAIVFSAPNARLSHKKFHTTKEKLDNYTINIIPEHDAVPRIDLPSLRSVHVACRVNPDAFPFDSIDCHMMLTTVCELQYTCGVGQGRPFLRACCCLSDDYRYYVEYVKGKKLVGKERPQCANAACPEDK